MRIACSIILAAITLQLLSCNVSRVFLPVTDAGLKGEASFPLTLSLEAPVDSQSISEVFNACQAVRHCKETIDFDMYQNKAFIRISFDEISSYQKAILMSSIGSIADAKLVSVSE